ncbi:KilA-N domain-containing protein [Companilactobacillus hulinensis]|uniref:KilA-N domain-containing protein n=1 Tax=Companilactobacillus hulinensis TaxID=2486007 RepID=UPI000F77FC13|nr:KilA-N domain-containing protein [Companilactobacillus hulinensis]
MTKNRDSINVKGIEVNLFSEGNNGDYISITGISKYKNQDNPNELIRNWMRSRSTLEYLGVWEQLNNPKFNNSEFTEILNQTGSNTFVMSPTKWIKSTNAIGIISQAGRYGGTYAQSDIAFEFATWISAEFKLYLIKDYQQLKSSESSHLNLEWDIKRTFSKINYKLHTDAIKENLIPSELTSAQTRFQYANEADRLNMSLFGLTAKQWKNKYLEKKGNIRDNATITQLTVLANLESMNAELIKDGMNAQERTKKLNLMAREQMETLIKNKIDERISRNNNKLN